MAIHMSAIKTLITDSVNTPETPGPVNDHINDMQVHDFALVSFTTAVVPGEYNTNHLVHSFIWHVDEGSGPRGIL